MARSWIQPKLRGFAAPQHKPEKDGLDPHRQAETEEANSATEKRETLTISEYRDPRDWLDHQRHAMRAEACLERQQTGDESPETKDR